MVRPERFELPTLWFVARCSIQLSYGRNNGQRRALIIAETLSLMKVLGFKVMTGAATSSVCKDNHAYPDGRKHFLFQNFNTGVAVPLLCLGPT
jgi:hypothetical protein